MEENTPQPTNTLYVTLADVPAGAAQIFLEPLCDAGLLDANALNMHDETIRAIVAIVRGMTEHVIG